MKPTIPSLLALALSLSAAAQQPAAQAESCLQIHKELALLDITAHQCSQGNTDITDYFTYLYTLRIISDPQVRQCGAYINTLKDNGQSMPYYGPAPQQDLKQYCSANRKERERTRQHAEAIVDRELPRIARETSQKSHRAYQEFKQQSAEQQNATEKVIGKWEQPKPAEEILREMREGLAAYRQKAQAALQKIDK
ncbi:MAG: hypothetical protein Q3966_09175 [Neisseria sp.]|nr:hypothetical protein [Neisseria sp.]